MTNNNYTQASSAYQQTSDENLSQMEIALELYKGIIKFLRQAKSAYQADDLEQMSYFVGRVLKVIEALHSHLDMEAGGKDSAFLEEFYVILIGRLGKLFDRPDMVREFDQLIDYVTPVYEQWYNLTYPKTNLDTDNK
jgi:flagellar protein FliS